MNPTSPDTNSVVAKSNLLIEKMAKFELSELRLIAYCVAHYDSRSPENRAFTAHVDDLASLFSMNGGSAYTVIRQAMLGINKKPLEFTEGKKRHFWNWFSGFTYTEGEGTFEFTITPEIQPYLLGLKGTFTRYRLGDVYQFKAASTWKMYENLKRWEAKGTWSIGLDELRLALGVAGKYPRWSDFQVRVIDATIKEINQLSDLTVSYEKEKRGRRITALTFLIKSKPPKGTVDVETPAQELHKGLLGCGVDQPTALKYAQDADRLGKASHALRKLSELKERWENGLKKGRIQAYVLSVLKGEIYQMELFEDPVKPKPDKAASQRNNALAIEATACYESGECTPTDSEKCRICQELYPGQK